MKVSFVCMAKIFLSVKKRHLLKTCIKQAKKKKIIIMFIIITSSKKKPNKETKKKPQTEPKSNIVP